jgi:hypothetical protein
VPINPVTRHDSRCKCLRCKTSTCQHDESAVEYEGGAIVCLGCGVDLRGWAMYPALPPEMREPLPS